MMLDANLVEIITNGLRYSLEEPIVFITQTDYVEHIFKTLAAMKLALAHKGEIDFSYFMELITKHHSDWLLAIAESKVVYQNLHETIKDAICYSVNYTVNCIKNKSKQLHVYLSKGKLTNQDIAFIKQEMKSIDKLSKNMEIVLNEKLVYFQQCTDVNVIAAAAQEEINQLLDWLDDMYSNSIISLCQLLTLWNPVLGAKIYKALALTAVKIKESNESKLNQSFHEIKVALYNKEREFQKVKEKIRVLDARISNNKYERIASYFSLIDMKNNLENRLQRIEYEIKELPLMTSEIDPVFANNKNMLDKSTPVFNHLLSNRERTRLVGQMLKIWGIAFGKRHDSSLEVVIKKHSDLLKGLTFVDQGGSIYYYDDHGRYYMDKDIEAQYIAPDNNSAPEDIEENSLKKVVNDENILRRLDDVFDTPKYHYDDLGRYKEENGEKIYKDIGSDTEYKCDDFGNFVKVLKKYNSKSSHLNALESSSTNATKYVKETIGVALKKCLAQVVLQQPKDPTKYLSELLIKYQKAEKVNNEENIESVRCPSSNHIDLPVKTTTITTDFSSLELNSNTDGSGFSFPRISTDSYDQSMSY